MAESSSSPSDSRETNHPSSTEDDNQIELTIQHHGQPQTFHFAKDATITDLSTRIASTLSIPPTHQKLMITPKTGLLKPPFASDPTLPLHTLTHKKIILMGSTATEISSVNNIPTTSTRNKPRIPAAKPASRRPPTQKALDESIYTFTTLRPLPYLPHPERSLTYLQRLRDDPGIRATMRSHRWTVPLLTEMNPVEHTTHESRTLGLNRNRGEVIELRLRTDAYDGYRDYKTIRKTLCHELAHNVYGEHDGDFWRLCREVEREVDRADWRSRGRVLTDEEFYTPPEQEGGDEGEGHVDHGGWEGGEYVLGGGGDGMGSDQQQQQQQQQQQGGGGQLLSRREILARAAEERIRRQRERERQAGGGG